MSFSNARIFLCRHCETPYSAYLPDDVYTKAVDNNKEYAENKVLWSKART
jgi:hypothetical protein